MGEGPELRVHIIEAPEIESPERPIALDMTEHTFNVNFSLRVDLRLRFHFFVNGIPLDLPVAFCFGAERLRPCPRKASVEMDLSPPIRMQKGAVPKKSFFMTFWDSPHFSSSILVSSPASISSYHCAVDKARIGSGKKQCHFCYFF